MNTRQSQLITCGAAFPRGTITKIMLSPQAEDVFDNPTTIARPIAITKVRPVQGRATPSIVPASRMPATSNNDAVTRIPVTHPRTLLALGPFAWSATLFANPVTPSKLRIADCGLLTPAYS